MSTAKQEQKQINKINKIANNKYITFDFIKNILKFVTNWSYTLRQNASSVRPNLFGHC